MGAALKPLLKRLAVGSPAALPTLDLDFLAQVYKVSDGAGGMNSVAFADLVAFTRSGAAWRYNEFGIYEQVAANQPRFDYDPVTLALRGLLIEEQRTNLLTYSSDASNAAWAKTDCTIDTSAEVAPDGSFMQSVTQGTANTSTLIRASGYGSSGTFTISRFMKRGNHDWVLLILDDASNNAGRAWFNLATGSLGATALVGSATGVSSRIDAAGNGIYRCQLTVTLPAAAPRFISLGVSGNSSTTRVSSGVRHEWGAGLEVGAFATSHIPTTSSQVTRAADVASVNTLSPWFNPEEGTLFVEGAPLSVAGPVKRAVALTNGTAQNRIVLDLAANTGVAEYLATAGGVSMASIGSVAVAAGGTIKMAGVYGTTDYRMAANGVLGTGAAPGGAVPTISKLELGALVGAQFFNGHIRRVRYWPRRLFDNELQRITA